MPIPRSIAKKGLIILVLLLAVELAFVAIIAFLIFKTRAQLLNEQNSLSVLETSSRIAKNLLVLSDLMTVKASTMIGQDQFDNELLKLQHVLDGDFKRLNELAIGDRDAQAICLEQMRYRKAAQNLYDENVQHKNFMTTHQAKDLNGAPVDFYQDAFGGYNHLLADYRKTRELRNSEMTSFVRQIKLLVFAGAMLNLFGGLALAYLFSIGFTRRIEGLSRIITELEASAMLDLNAHSALVSNGEKGGRDEILEIARAFSHMLSDLEQAERSEAMLVDSAYDVICAINEEGRFVDINSASLAQWGYPAEALVGQHIRTILTAADLVKFTSNISAIRDSGAGALELIVQTGSGVLDTRWSCYWSSMERLLFCFVHDTSELSRREKLLKQAEEQVSTLVSNLPLGVLVVAADGQVKIANPKMAELVGASMVRPGSTVAIEQIFKTEAAEVSKTTLRDSGEVLFVVKDVRERLRLENIKRDFIAILQESLHQPLKQVRDSIALVAHGGKDDNKAQRIVRNSDRLLQLIDELVKVETLRPGKLIGELKPVHFSTVLTDAVSALAGYAATRGVTLELGSQPATVLADRERLLQVVINLLSNAIKFSDSGSTVKLYHMALPGPGDWLEVSIADSGKGIPVEMREAIFEPYAQAGSSDRQKGTGLGLAICRTIIEAHSGLIGVESLPAGSRFWFRLPLQPQSEDQA